MQYHKLDFLQACDWLARWAGMALPLIGERTLSAHAPNRPTAGSASENNHRHAEELARWQSGCLLFPLQRDGTPAAQPGADYLQARGIPQSFAVCSGVTFHPNWYGDARVVFPIMRPTDGDIDNAEIMALQGRAITPTVSKRDRLRCVGAKGEGAFWTPGAWWQETIIFTEGEIEALTLAECGFPAVATCGAGNHAKWLGEMCRGKRVIIAFDDDTGGENGANSLAAILRQSGVREIRGLLPPEIRHADGKAFDWNDCLQAYGRDAVRKTMLDELSCNFATIDTMVANG